MSFLMGRIYGACGAVVIIACAGASKAMDRAANWKPATASVSYIDREC